MIQLISGPPGSGKTAYVLERARQSLAADASAVILVPTSTSAEHYRHLLAREGFILQPRSVTTLSSFVAKLTPDAQPPSAALLDFLIRDALAPGRIGQFQSVAQYPGFRDRVLQLMDEFAAANVGAERLEQACEKAGVSSPEVRGFLAIYQRVEQQLVKRRLPLRGARIASAAKLVANRLAGVTELLLDGFYAFSDPEREFLLQASKNAALHITIPDDWPEALAARQFFLKHGATERKHSSNAPPPQVALVSATSREEEIQEIARRVVGRAEHGTPLREIGVVLRGEHPYAANLRSVFARFGIPARFYFPLRLDQQAPVRMLDSVISGVLSGWDLERVLEILRFKAAGVGGTAEGDRLDHAVLTAIPGHGLATVDTLQSVLEPLSSWSGLHRTPKQWVVALAPLVRLVHPGRKIQPATHDEALRWRVQAQALEAWTATLEAVAQYQPSIAVTLDAFWLEAREAIRLTPLRVADQRRNVVQVMDVLEARQWRLQHVFVCGLLEGAFPRQASPDAFFSDGARLALRAQGIHLRTAADRQAEEDLLVGLAVTRAPQIVLSWPSFDDKGEERLPSFALAEFQAPREKAQPVRPRPHRDAVLPPTADRVPMELIVERLGGASKKWSASEIERFLQCPFRHFSDRTLRLVESPKPPAERFGPLQHGSLVHNVLHQLHQAPVDSLDDVFDRAFRELCRKENVNETHRVEWARLAMLRNLRAFLETNRPPEGWTSHAEYMFEFPLIEGLIVRGRIDRFDEDSQGNVIAIDFKYSGSARAKDLMKSEEAVQGGLYLLALKHLGKRPKEFHYVPLRGDAKPVENRNVEELMQHGRERTIDAVERIRRGEIVVAPADSDICRYCAFRSVCRVSQQAKAIGVGSEPEWS